ncbi:MAG: biotin transporter BioY [Candidatus Marinimicrobia bacterium]|jgi:biotin transport system substrate-specific component|nr:biotin transporter BioY [Candidatus Neomarinimicrobiota bacterium]MBT3732621.1 biotin transporter BioY [Candidatus Neomarinimicrobiota bacterium]MBT4145260.1 biotin transporter BioY [Candidatus Neomarinimicrobiota bacterium]MBT4177613.1 biotin transporter BioY [Candidatus Neomarinimicrobiota bacterium]MBT4593564.1 biotin transporter BioY [Candidatus Neomarinimicrobiota bacterium]
MKTKTISLKKVGMFDMSHQSASILSIVLGSLLIVLFAQISIPLPFSPVPITGQTLAVLLVGSMLGSRRGAMAVLLYLMEGALGLPVFASMKAGSHILIGPTAGYLWGFVIASFFMGYISENGFNKNMGFSAIYCLLGTLIILMAGVLYLSIFRIGFSEAMMIGFYPFILGGIIKSIICAGLITGAKKLQ